MNERLDLQRMADNEPAFELAHSLIDNSIALQRVPCNVCQHDVPLSEALVAEATDYVVYFCGLDCYERWRNQVDNSDRSSRI